MRPSTFLRRALSGVLILAGLAFLCLSATAIISSLIEGRSNTFLDLIQPTEEGFRPFAVPVTGTESEAMAPTLDVALLVRLERDLMTQQAVTPDLTHEPEATPDEAEHSLQTAIAQAATPESQQNLAPMIPDRIMIPSIRLDAQVIEATSEDVFYSGEKYVQWEAPNQPAAGWHPTSARLGEEGNTVINGHHNVHGKVFANLVDVKVGDRIVVFSGDQYFLFMVNQVMVLPEKKGDLDLRLENARWIERSEDERLTLITCWPAKSNTHRVVVVASPYHPQAHH
jgi:sortase A